MNGSRFDDISRRLALAGDRIGSRRGLIKAGVGAGLAATVGVPDVCAATPATGDGTSRPIRRQTSPDDLLVQQIAFDLDYDVDRIFRFVADEIAYESYDGALRGVRGTIWSGAGNSVDQAQLLAALLTEALADTRFAVGTLAGPDAETLFAAMASPRAESRVLTAAQGLSRADVGGSAPAGSAATPSPGQPEAEAVADRIDALRDDLLSAASASLNDDVALLTGLLADAGVEFPPNVAALAGLEVDRHVWLQVRRGSEWVDLDPSFAGADIGTTPATLVETLTELPEEIFHTLTFRVIADTVAGESISEKVMLDYTSRSQDLVGEDLLLSHLEPEFLTGLGAGINEALGGQIASYPLIVLGQESYLADSMLIFGSGGGILGEDALGGDAGITDGECLAERYEVTVTSPGVDPVTSSRILFDRVPASQRAGGTLVLVDIPPVREVDLGNGERGLLEVNQVVAMAAVVSAVDRFYLGRPLGDDAVASFTGAIHGMHALREALDAAETARPATYLDRPNVTAYTFRPVPPSNGDALSVRLDADLLHQGYGLRAPGPDASGVFAGVLAQKAERLALDRRLFEELFELGAIPTRPRRPIADVQSVFDAARDAAIPFVVLTSDDAPTLSTLHLDEIVTARLASVLASGKVIILPADPVRIDGTDTTAWWVYDRTTGAIVDQLPDGRGGATLSFSPMSEYITIVRAQLKAWKGYIALGACLAALARGAASALQQSADSAGGALNRLGNFEGALFACAGAAAAA